MIERLYTCPAAGAPQIEHHRVRVVAGKGIEGDRYFGRDDEPGQNVTFVEAEEIEAFQDAAHRPHDLSVTHRNVVTRGVRLNDLVGKEFTIGGVRFRGRELCEPCRGLGKRLQSPDLTAADVVKRLVHRAGLRADALSSGDLARGMKLLS
jgi:MOSC domain-containing protein YiiM